MMGLGILAAYRWTQRKPILPASISPSIPTDWRKISFAQWYGYSLAAFGVVMVTGMFISIFSPDRPGRPDPFTLIAGLICGTPMIAIVPVGSMAPSIVAANRDHPQLASILVINLLLGWTLLGYAVATFVGCR